MESGRKVSFHHPLDPTGRHILGLKGFITHLGSYPCSQSDEWKDPHAAADMMNLLHVRGTVLSLLEKARGTK